MPNDFPDWTAAASMPIVLGSVVATAGNTNTGVFSIPAGAVSIGYGVDSSGGNAVGTNARITGNQTLAVYRNDSNPGIPPVHAALLMPNETSVTVSVTAGAVNPSKLDVFCWMVPITSTVTVDVASPVPVTFLNVGANFVSQSAPWQSPNRAPLGISMGGLAVNGTSTLVAGVAGQIVYLFNWSISSDSLSNDAVIELQDSAGTTLAAYSQETASFSPPFNFFGAPCVQGNGIRLKNTGNNASGNLRGALTFSQA